MTAPVIVSAVPSTAVCPVCMLPIGGLESDDLSKRAHLGIAQTGEMVWLHPQCVPDAYAARALALRKRVCPRCNERLVHHDCRGAEIDGEWWNSVLFCADGVMTRRPGSAEFNPVPFADAALARLDEGADVREVA